MFRKVQTAGVYRFKSFSGVIFQAWKLFVFDIISISLRRPMHCTYSRFPQFLLPGLNTVFFPSKKSKSWTIVATINSHERGNNLSHSNHKINHQFSKSNLPNILLEAVKPNGVPLELMGLVHLQGQVRQIVLRKDYFLNES